MCWIRTKVLSLCCRCLEFLLQSGATASLKDQQGYSPVHYAAAYGHRHCLELVGTHTQTHAHKRALMGEIVYCWLVSPGVFAICWLLPCTKLSGGCGPDVPLYVRAHSQQPCLVRFKWALVRLLGGVWFGMRRCAYAMWIKEVRLKI